MLASFLDGLPPAAFTALAVACALATAGLMVATVVLALREARRAPADVRRAAGELVGVCTPARVDALLGRGAADWREALDLTLVAIGDDPRAATVAAFVAQRSTPSLERHIRAHAPRFPSGRSGDDVRAALTALSL